MLVLSLFIRPKNSLGVSLQTQIDSIQELMADLTSDLKLPNKNYSD